MSYGTFVPGTAMPAIDGPALWFLFQGYRLLVARDGGRAAIPLIDGPETLGLTAAGAQYIGYYQSESGVVHCLCAEVAGDGDAPDGRRDPPPGFVFENLRPLYASLDEPLFWLAGRAVQIVDWDRTNRYCGRCGEATAPHPTDRAKVCPNCGHTDYPRLAPAVIVRIQRRTAAGPEILLARANRFPAAMYSVLAGFVEPGETLEECVAREIHEETGIYVKNITYFGSQPWPFPHSLMIAFTADYDSGELVVDPVELADANWFAPDELPNIPPPPSIANQLITTWLAAHRS